MEIKLSELRRIFDEILSEMEDGGYESIDLDLGYYWEVPPAVRYDVYQEPEKLTVGDLEYDWERLMSILQGDDVPIRYSLVWLSALLRAVGETKLRKNEGA